MTETPLFALLFWLVLLPAIWSVGSFAAARLRISDPLMAGVYNLAFGLGVYAYFPVLAGTIGWLKPQAVLAFFAISFLTGWKRGMGVFTWFRQILAFWMSARGVFSRFFQIVFVVTVFFTALFCFLPEISNDALGIHLYLAKLFVRNASFAPSDYDITSYRPLLMTALYTTGLFFQNVAISKLFHWVCGILLVTALALKINEATRSAKLATFMSLMLWLTPTMMNQITTTYIDAGVALFFFLGFCLVIDDLTELRMPRFFYGGLLIGLSVAMRSLSLVAMFGLLFILGARLFNRNARARVLAASCWLVTGVVLASAYWFVRDWICTGNPVYPYLGSFFGNKELAYLSELYFQDMGLPKSPLTFLTIFWDITFRPHYFDYHHWVGPFYLAALPLTIFAGFRIQRVRPHLAFVLYSVAMWYFTGQNVRYLLPVLPIYLYVTAVGARLLFEPIQMKSVAKLAVLAASAFVAALTAVSIYHFRNQFLPLFRLQSVQDYLVKTERTVPLAEWVNKYLPDNACLLSFDEPHLFYFNRRVFLDLEFNLKTSYQSISDPAGIVRLLKDKGVTHILSAAEIYDRDFPVNFKRVNRPIDKVLNDPLLSKRAASIPSQNVLGRRCRYEIYVII